MSETFQGRPEETLKFPDLPEGESDEFKELKKLHEGVVRSIILQEGFDDDQEVEDLTTLVFTELYKRSDSFNGLDESEFENQLQELTLKVIENQRSKAKSS